MISSNQLIRNYIIILLLIVSTAALYWQVRAYDFVYYDDQEYVFENRHVQEGLTMDAIKWAFSSTYASNWHPLTWLSHMADRQFFGASPAGPHVVNVFLHILNSILLMVLLYRMTGGFWQSAFVAALFALHPLHVESVAWVAERKDVLSTMFFMLTVLLYVRYAERPGIAWYLVSFFCFVLGLMAKPMLVTLPFVLLLMDFWPLKRFDLSFFTLAAQPSQGQTFRLIALEKAPFLMLAVLSSVITIIAQRQTMATIEGLPVATRIGNAIISYAAYLVKMVWPSDLAVFYPLTTDLEHWKIALSAFLLIAVSVWTVRSARKRPYLLVGWLWYAITLVPVIGIVQVGRQSMADRYTYIPLIGIFIMAAWGLSDVVARWPRFRAATAASTFMMLAVLAVLTWMQVGYWKDTYTLFSRCVAVTQNNFVAMGVLGNNLVKLDRPAEALVFLQRSSELNGKDADVQHGIGMALLKLGKDADAAEQIQAAVNLNPQSARAHNDLGIIIAKSGDSRGAVKQFSEAVRIEPDNLDFRYELGVSLVDAGRLDEAIAEYNEVLREAPAYVKAHNNIGVALAMQGNMNEAIKHFLWALDLDPANEDARRNLELARRMLNAAKAAH